MWDKDEQKIVAMGATKIAGSSVGAVAGMNAGASIGAAVSAPICAIPVVGPIAGGLTFIACMTGGTIAGGLFGWKAPGIAMRLPSSKGD